MVRNQALTYHRVYDRQYDLTGLRTGSVRDQLLRAITLTQGLIVDTKEIGPSPRHGLLILGGGPAGIACALIAAENDIQATVLERERSEFLTLAAANTRRVAPFEYDWPRRHSPSGRFPSGVPNFILNFQPKAAAKLAADWQTALDNWRATNPKRSRLEIIHGADARTFEYATVANAQGAVISILVTGNWDGATRSSREFGAVVNCTGYMVERTFHLSQKPHHLFRGHRFWHDADDLHESGFGVDPNYGDVKSVLISGGGDGAMQDIQRAATGKFGIELLDQLQLALGVGNLSEYFFSLVQADDAAKRAYAWKMATGPQRFLPVEMAKWNKKYLAIARHILRRYTATGATLEQLAEKVLKDSIWQRQGPEIVWVFREEFAEFAYSLNRLLSYIVVSLLRRFQSSKVVRPSTEIMSIRPLDPTWGCCPRPARCHGLTHLVTFIDRTTGLESIDEEFQIIILRHGLIFPKKPYLGSRSPLPEQMIPYDIPR